MSAFSPCKKSPLYHMSFHFPENIGSYQIMWQISDIKCY